MFDLFIITRVENAVSPKSVAEKRKKIKRLDEFVCSHLMEFQMYCVRFVEIFYVDFHFDDKPICIFILRSFLN